LHTPFDSEIVEKAIAGRKYLGENQRPAARKSTVFMRIEHRFAQSQAHVRVEQERKDRREKPRQTAWMLMISQPSVGGCTSSVSPACA
jgi:hypothetical protein